MEVAIGPLSRSRRLSLGAVLLLLGIAAAALVLHGTLLAASTSGPTWGPAGLAGQTVHALAFPSTPGATAFAATEDGVYRQRGDGAWRRVLRAPTVWSVAAAEGGRLVVAGTQAGEVCVSEDGGDRWRCAGLNLLGVFAVVIEPGRTAVLLAGAGEGIYRSADTGHTWTRTLRLPASAGSAFAWMPGMRGTVFAGVVAGGAGGATGVYRSRDAGATWTPYGRGLQSFSGIMALALSPRHELFAGTMGNAAWSIAADAGRWQRVATGMPPSSDHVAALVAMPDHAASLVAATLGHGAFRTADAGAHWTALSSGLPAQGDGIVLSLAYVPRAHRLYAGTADGLYRLSFR